MALDREDQIFKDVAALTLEGLKSLSAKGEPLTEGTLYTIIRPLLEERGLSPEGENVENAKGEIERLTQQKTKLVSELGSMEERLIDSDSLFRRMILFFVGALEQTVDEKQKNLLKTFKDILKKNAPLEMLEGSFTNLKSGSYSKAIDVSPEDASSASSEKGKTFFSGLFKGKSTEALEYRYIQQFKDAYREIVETLGLDVNAAFLNRLSGITRRIQTSITTDDFESLRRDILTLLQDYIGYVASEREGVADFVKDLGAQLIAFEKVLSSTFENTDAIYASEDEFSEIITAEMDTMAELLRSDNTLADLKRAMISKIDTLRTAVAEKDKREQVIRQQLDGDISRLKTEFQVIRMEAEKAREQVKVLENEILTDPLTGIFNRRAYDKRISEEFQRLKRYQRPFALLVFDIDRFKNINDNYGHAIGDKCLKVIIERMKPLIRDTDMLARYGGEEFVVILPETDSKGAFDAGEKLRISVEQTEFLHKNERVRITVSVGASVVLLTDKKPADLFSRADMAVYEAKETGRNRVVVR